MRRLNSSWRRSIAFVVRSDFHWQSGKRVKVNSRSPAPSKLSASAGDCAKQIPTQIATAPPFAARIAIEVPVSTPTDPGFRRPGDRGLLAVYQLGDNASRQIEEQRRPHTWGADETPSARHRSEDRTDQAVNMEHWHHVEAPVDGGQFPEIGRCSTPICRGFPGPAAPSSAAR